MRRVTRLLLPCCLLTYCLPMLSLPALADDVGTASPVPVIEPTGTLVEPGSLPHARFSPEYIRRSRAVTIEQFKSSSYWTVAPQTFDPGEAPSFRHGLARDGGVHTRYPYFKYRAPWIYQGPAGVSHTIVWERFAR